MFVFHAIILRNVSFSASSSDHLRTLHSRRWPCSPLMLPRWQSGHSGTDRNHLPCSISWHSLGPGASHSTHAIALMRSIWRRSAAVGAGLLRLCTDQNGTSESSSSAALGGVLRTGGASAALLLLYADSTASPNARDT